ncbi:MAG: hypothetical protein WC240_08165 [Bacilli bacterium]
MTKVTVSKKFLDNLPKSIIALRFEYYDSKINDVWVSDWYKYTHDNETWWINSGNLKAISSATLIQKFNAMLSPANISKPKIIFARKRTESGSLTSLIELDKLKQRIANQKAKSLL